MADFHFVDTTMLIDLGKEAAHYNPTALNALYIPDNTVVVTSTVYDEATRNHLQYADAAAIKIWLDVGRALGRIIIEPTPGFPAGVDNMGELSLVDTANNLYHGQPVTFVSNDKFFNNFDGTTNVPNQRHYTHQELLLESFFEGGISSAEYFVSSANMAIHSGEAPKFFPGQQIIGSNGVTIDASNPTQVEVTPANGEPIYLDPFERFRLDAYGNVEKLGRFIPGLGIFVPEDPLDFCFLAGTMIDMWDGTQKPIEQVTPDDWVVSYDKDGNLLPGRVTRVLQNDVTHVLDVFGLKVTPGHVTLCGDGEFDGEHVPIIDILRSDGALVRKDGSKVRACTGIPVGDPEDEFIWAITGDRVDGGGIRVRDKGRIRIGTRVITADGDDVSVAELIFSNGAHITDEGLIRTESSSGQMPFLWTFSEALPNPEDYVLRKSALHLSEIYQVAEWEGVQPKTPAPTTNDLRQIQKARGITSVH